MKLDDLKWLIENIFEISPLLTKHQRDRYNRLKYGVITKFNRVETKEEYEEFINNTKPISDNHSLDDKSIPQPFLDNWISGFINGEGSFSIHNKGHLFFILNNLKTKY